MNAYRALTQGEFEEILEKHRLWLKGKPGGARADLAGTRLVSANLTRADLSRANLKDANLIRADLSGANLTRANLTGANLSVTDLTRANLTGANLTGAHLEDARGLPSLAMRRDAADPLSPASTL